MKLDLFPRRFSVVALLAALAFSACEGGDDDDSPPAADADPGAPDAGAAAYMESCTLDPDNCEEPEMCFMFNMDGPLCTHACSTPADCPAPSTGCNMMGVCKSP
jgi:hypothetical protein